MLPVTGRSASTDYVRGAICGPHHVCTRAGLVQAVQGFELVLPPAGTWAVLQAAGMDPSGKDPQYPVQVRYAFRMPYRYVKC